MELLKNRDSQPCYGIINFKRVHCNSEHLYGSEVAHTDVIEMTVKRSDCVHELNHDWYFGKDDIIQLQMSSAQFAQLITSLNMGEGVPCTLTYTEKDGDIPQIKWVGQKEKIHNDFNKQMESLKTLVTDDLDEVCGELDSKNVNLTRQRELSNKLKQIGRILYDKIPFINKSFMESTDKVQTQAIQEVEARIQSKINYIGMQNINTQNLIGVIENGK